MSIYSLTGRVDHDKPLPYYIQLKEILLGQIQTGVLKPGDQLPSEPDLCDTYGVSRTVVRQALQELQREGLIYKRKGKGTFVAAPKISESLVQKLTGFYQDMKAQGHRLVTQVLRQEVIPAPPKIAGYLGLAPETPVIVIERLRFVNDEPIVLVTTYLPYAACPEVAVADLAQQSLYDFLERACNKTITRGRRVIEAVLATPYEANLLAIRPKAPLIMLDSVSYLEDGTPIEYYHALHRADRSCFEVELVRAHEPGGASSPISVSSADLPPSNLVTGES